MMTDSDIEMADAEAIDLRRQWRVATLWQAYKLGFRLLIGQILLKGGRAMIEPCVSPTTQTALDIALSCHLSNDIDTINEGLQERRKLLEKRLRNLMDGPANDI